MSDPPSPPKSKPGSLRDRIAAFEKQQQSAPTSGPPAPRPKPAGMQWKPRPPSPPSPASSSTDHAQTDERKIAGAGGMSASDAKESIGKGGTLKERMAALQGRGGFGGPPPPVPPKLTEKPKWKPPPVVSPPADDDDKQLSGDPHEALRSPPAEVVQSPEGEGGEPSDEVQESANQDADAAVDPDEEERQRRAAIAARLARLGGARFGMGAPFGQGPTMAKKKVELPKEDVQKEVETTSVKSQDVDDIEEHPAAESNPPSRKGSIDLAGKNSSSLSVDETSVSAPPPSRIPMPVPLGPRRAPPPRKKLPKAPSPAQEQPHIVLGMEQSESPAQMSSTGGNVDTIPGTEKDMLAGDIEREIGEVNKSVEDHLTLSDAAPTIPAHEELAEEAAISVEPAELEAEARADSEIPESHVTHEHEAAQEPAEIADAAAEEEDEVEDDEVERRKRIAEKLASMGAFNPFAGPPPVPRHVSSDDMAVETTSFEQHVETEPETDEEAQVEIASPVPPRRESVEEASPVSPEPERHASIQESNVTPAVAHARAPDEFDIVAEAHEENIIAGEEHADKEHDGNDLMQEVSDPEVYEDADELLQSHEDRFTHDDERHLEYDIDETAEDQGAAIDHQSHDSFDVRDGRSGIDIAYASEHLQESHNQEPAGSFPSVIEAEEHGNQGQTKDPDRKDGMTPPCVTRPMLPPPINLISGPVVSPVGSATSSPLSPPPPVSQRIIRVDDEESARAESPDIPPRPVLPPFSPRKNTPIAEPEPEPEEEVAPAPPPRGSLPPPPRRTSIKVAATEAPTEETVPSRPIHSHSPVTLVRIPPTPFSPRPIAQRNAPDTVTYNEPDEIERSAYESTEPEPANAAPEEMQDEEQTRRQTIAERMARLGAVRFGAPMPLPARRAESHESVDETEETEQQPAEAEEEEELARKQRIAAKLAGMGGMRLGMLPQPMGRGRKPVLIKREDSENEETSSQAPLPIPAPAPHRLPLPARPPPVPRFIESRESSEDGVRVEAEESELEDVSHEDASDEGSVPPPIPSRAGRRDHSASRTDALPTPPPRTMSRSPPVPGVRPPIPSIPASIYNRRPSIQIHRSPTRKSSVDHSSESQFLTPPRAPPPPDNTPIALHPPHSEYVMVETPDSVEPESAPPPPPRLSRGPPPRGIPPPPPPPPSAIEPNNAMVTSQWELPAIPSASLDLGLRDGSDASEESWTEAPPPPPPRRVPSQSSSQMPPHRAQKATEVQLSAEDLMAVWGKVGVRICEAATTLHEKSKKSLIGDGSYLGFVMAVLNGVPNAMQPSDMEFGHLVYAQTSSAVQRRISDIMPGDIVVLYDAKFKGHKGLQTYHQSVGVGEPLVGVVGEFEMKKTKVKVFQANQHVGQQTVESVSYRLEDLKSGHIKIFRVLEA